MKCKMGDGGEGEPIPMIINTFLFLYNICEKCEKDIIVKQNSFHFYHKDFLVVIKFDVA